jgi:hypothetical protein
MPALPPPLRAVSICELMTITPPRSFSSGPPELSGLIGASVCRTRRPRRRWAPGSGDATQRWDAQDRQVIGGALADQLCFERLSAAKSDDHLGSSRDHMPVGEDRAGAIDLKARAGGRAALTAFAFEVFGGGLGLVTPVAFTNTTPGAAS